MCNFPKPGADDPALLLHTQVTTFFHEFGHLLHHLFGGRQRFLRFSGLQTERDFVEVPSQLYEEWAWDPAVLADFAKHHETGGAREQEQEAAGLGDESQVEDLAQDTFVRAFSSLANFKLGGNFQSWLFGIAYHVHVDNLRKRREKPVQGLGAPDPQVMREGREHLRGVWFAFLGREGAARDDDEILSYRAAVGGALGGTAVMLGWFAWLLSP